MRAKHTEHTVILFILFFSTPFTINAQSSLKLWYNRPATQWVEALPVGNGRIGGMIYGGVAEELIQLNESTLYSGGPVKTNINPESPGYLPEIREALLKEEDYTKASLLTKKMQGLFTESYLPLGDIMIRHNFRGATLSAYYRDLDIQKAIATTRFTIDGVEYVREIFTSSPANIMMVRIRSAGKNAVSFDVSARSQLHYDVMVNGNNDLLINGKAPAHADPGYLNPIGREHEVYGDTTGCNGMRFQYRIKAMAKDGKVIADTADPSITKYVVYWNNGSDSVVLKAGNSKQVDTVKCYANNLGEFIYAFSLFSFDDKGNRSIETRTQNTKVYGSLYAAGLINRPFNAKDPNRLSGDTLTLNFNAPDTVNITTEIKYTSVAGGEKRVFLASDQSIITIPDYKRGQPVLYRSSYKPLSLAIDTFYVSTYTKSLLRNEVKNRHYRLII